MGWVFCDGRLPEPDVVVGSGNGVKYGWSVQTVDAWQANRPDRGARTDLAVKRGARRINIDTGAGCGLLLCSVPGVSRAN
ncbi:hypothetical protein [Arcanobacterium canis]